MEWLIIDIMKQLNYEWYNGVCTFNCRGF